MKGHTPPWCHSAWRLALFGAIAFWVLNVQGRAETLSVVERTDQPWKIQSLTEDASLRGASIFTLDFEKKGNASREGTVWIASSDGLHEYDGYRWQRHGREQGLPSEFVRCVLVTSRGAVSVGTDQGAGLYQRGTFLRMGSESCSTSDGRLLSVGAIASRRKAFMEWRSNAWVQVSADFRVPADFVMDLREAPDGSVWTVGNDCLIRWPRRGAQWDEFPGQQTPRFADRHGGVWFFEDQTPNFAPPPPDRHTEDRWERLEGRFETLRCLPSGDVVWGWSGSNVTRIANNVSTTFSTQDSGLSVVHASCADARDRFWLLGNNAQGEPIVAGHDGLRWLPPKSVPEFRGMRLRPFASASTQGPWFAADHGPRTDAVLVHITPTGNPSRILPKASIGLFRSELHCDASDQLWYFGETGLFRWKGTGQGSWETIPNLPSRQIVGCVERDDELWFACSGYLGGSSALLKHRADQWTTFRVESVHNISLARDGTVLAGGDEHFYRVAPGSDSTPIIVNVPVEDSIRAILKDPAGTYWLAAGQSVFRFRPDRTPPETWIHGPSRLLAESSATVFAGLVERYRPRGLRSDAQFLWRMDLGPWSSTRSNTTYEIPTTLKTGRHRLEVAGIDAGGDRDDSPAILAFDVFPMPLQNRSWFLPAAGGTVLILALLTVVAFSARIALADHARTLENRVDLRTRLLRSEITERLEIERKLRQSHQQLRALAFRVEAIREDERTAISRGIHDELGQMLSGLKMDLRWLAKRIGAGVAISDTAPLRERLHEAAKLTDETIATVQRIATELRPGALDTLGLIDAIRDETRRFENRSGITLHLELPETQIPSHRALDTAFFRIFQELLTNVARHSQASHVRVRLTDDDSSMTLEVEDDGIGITSEAIARANSLGLLGMSERAAALGGRFEIRRGVRAGTIARVSVPKPASQDKVPPVETQSQRTSE